MPGFGSGPFGSFFFGEWYWGYNQLVNYLPAVYRQQDADVGNGALTGFLTAVSPSLDDLRHKIRDFGDLRDPLKVQTDHSTTYQVLILRVDDNGDGTSNVFLSQGPNGDVFTNARIGDTITDGSGNQFPIIEIIGAGLVANVVNPPIDPAINSPIGGPSGKYVIVQNVQASSQPGLPTNIIPLVSGIFISYEAPSSTPIINGTNAEPYTLTLAHPPLAINAVTLTWRDGAPDTAITNEQVSWVPSPNGGALGPFVGTLARHPLYTSPLTIDWTEASVVKTATLSGTNTVGGTDGANISVATINRGTGLLSITFAVTHPPDTSSLRISYTPTVSTVFNGFFTNQGKPGGQLLAGSSINFVTGTIVVNLAPGAVVAFGSMLVSYTQAGDIIGVGTGVQSVFSFTLTETPVPNAEVIIQWMHGAMVLTANIVAPSTIVGPNASSIAVASLNAITGALSVTFAAGSFPDGATTVVALYLPADDSTVASENLLAFLASDYGIQLDRHDPEFLQRSYVYNAYALFDLKGTEDGYQILGKMAGYFVNAIPLYALSNSDIVVVGIGTGMQATFEASLTAPVLGPPPLPPGLYVPPTTPQVMVYWFTGGQQRSLSVFQPLNEPVVWTPLTDGVSLGPFNGTLAFSPLGGDPITNRTQPVTINWTKLLVPYSAKISPSNSVSGMGSVAISAASVDRRTGAISVTFNAGNAPDTNSLVASYSGVHRSDTVWVISAFMDAVTGSLSITFSNPVGMATNEMVPWFPSPDGAGLGPFMGTLAYVPLTTDPLTINWSESAAAKSAILSGINTISGTNGANLLSASVNRITGVILVAFLAGHAPDMNTLTITYNAQLDARPELATSILVVYSTPPPYLSLIPVQHQFGLQVPTREYTDLDPIRAQFDDVPADFIYPAISPGDLMDRFAFEESGLPLPVSVRHEAVVWAPPPDGTALGPFVGTLAHPPITADPVIIEWMDLGGSKTALLYGTSILAGDFYADIFSASIVRATGAILITFNSGYAPLTGTLQITYNATSFPFVSQPVTAGSVTFVDVEGAVNRYTVAVFAGGNGDETYKVATAQFNDSTGSAAFEIQNFKLLTSAPGSTNYQFDVFGTAPPALGAGAMNWRVLNYTFSTGGPNTITDVGLQYVGYTGHRYRIVYTGFPEIDFPAGMPIQGLTAPAGFTSWRLPNNWWFVDFAGIVSILEAVTTQPVSSSSCNLIFDVISASAPTAGRSHLFYSPPSVGDCNFCRASLLRLDITANAALAEDTEALSSGLDRLIDRLGQMVPVHVRLAEFVYDPGPAVIEYGPWTGPYPTHPVVSSTSEEHSYSIVDANALFDDALYYPSDAIATDQPIVATSTSNIVSQDIFEEQVDEANSPIVTGAWGATGLWRSFGYRYSTAPNAFAYNQNGSGVYPTGVAPDYNTGIATTGTLTSPVISAVVAATHVYLRFRQFADVSSGVINDLCTVQVVTSPGNVVIVTINKTTLGIAGTGSTGGWVTYQQDVVAQVVGAGNFYLQYIFDSVAVPPAGKEGWYIDSIEVQVVP